MVPVNNTPSGIHPLGIITTACLADMTQKIEESCCINEFLPPPVNVCGKYSWQVKVYTNVVLLKLLFDIICIFNVPDI